MDFLFADSTTTGFQTNFLEALRDAIDFAASIALSDERIGTAEDRIRALQVNADAQASRLEQLARSVLSVLDLEKGPPGSPSDILASELGPTVSARHQAVAASITEKLGEDIRFIAAETLAARNRYRTALEAYLLARDPPDATTVLRLALVDGGKDDDTYEATLVGRSDMGLMWSIDLQVPPKTMWAAALRVDRVVDGLEILAPQQAGLIKRAVKVKKQKLNRYVVTSFADDGTTVRVELRLELGGEAGFDLSANLRKSEISATRIGAADDAAAGAFEVSADDTRALLDFATKLRAGALALPRKRLAEATFDGAPFDGTIVDAQPRLVGIVERLIAKVAPTVREIAARSHTRDELVLRRQLADGRREEIFLPTSVLRDKVAALGDAHRALFAPLGLEARALESVEQSDAVVDTTEIEEPAQEKQEENGESEGEPSAPSDEVADTEEHETSVIIRSEVPPSSHPPVSPAEPSSHGPPSSRGDLAASLKDIRALSREGRTEDAHRAFAAFFRSSAFTSARADDQRLALKLLVLPKPPSTISDAMKDAFEAAIGPLQSLILAHREPADYEMLGAAYVVLGEPVKATGIFKKALDLERARNPASDLCGNLMRRVSEIQLRERAAIIGGRRRNSRPSNTAARAADSRHSET